MLILPRLIERPAGAPYRQRQGGHPRPMISSYLRLRPMTTRRLPRTTRLHRRRHLQNQCPNLAQPTPILPNLPMPDDCRHPIPVCHRHLHPWPDRSHPWPETHRPTQQAPTAARTDPDPTYHPTNGTTETKTNCKCSTPRRPDEVAGRHHPACPTNQHRLSCPPSRGSRSHRDCLPPFRLPEQSRRVGHQVDLPDINSNQDAEVGGNRRGSPL